MNGYKISEAARATGFSESALRFYEQQGVVIPERTSTGYRQYNEEHVDSLRFVARGKELGLSLDEITELLRLLDQDECEPVQTRIRQLIDHRIEEARTRITELVGFSAQLQRAATRLAAHTSDGSCDDQCGCRSEPESRPTDERRRIPLGGPTTEDIVCTLDANLFGSRIDEWYRALADSIGREPIANGVRVRFSRAVDVAALAELAAAEQTCCAFFRFQIGIESDGVFLDVTGSDEAQTVITSIFGAAA